jgi:hypothetical protein
MSDRHDRHDKHQLIIDAYERILLEKLWAENDGRAHTLCPYRWHRHCIHLKSVRVFPRLNDCLSRVGLSSICMRYLYV